MLYSSIRYPALWVFLCLALCVAAAAGLPKVVRDVTTDALIPPGDLANAHRQEINEVFGLKDPLVIGLVANSDKSIYSIEGLSALVYLHESVKSTNNVRPDRVKSLVSELAISGTGTEVKVDQFVPSGPATEQDVEKAVALVQQTPLVQKILVSDDGKEALVVAELIDHKIADQTYELLEKTLVQMGNDDFGIYVAGQGAVSGYFNKYLSIDSRRMLPIGLSVIFIVLLITFRSFKSSVGPLIVVIGTVLATIGLKGWFGVSFFVITTSLPALLVAVAVADSIHLLSEYFSDRLSNPQHSHRESMELALKDQAVPITLTSITSSIGFLALAFFSSMPPMFYFGLFAAIGVLIAWILSLFLLPPLTVYMQLEPSKGYRRIKEKNKDSIARLMSVLINQSASYPRTVLGAFLILSVMAGWLLTHVQFDRRQVENFTVDAPIRIADELFNEHFAGTSYLDVMVKSPDEEGMLSVDAMKQVSALQQHLSSLPGVQKTQSIADYLSTLDQAFNPDQQQNVFHRLPETDEGVAQYVLFLESSADPTALRDRIDGRYQSVLVRAYINDSSYRHNSETVNAVRTYVKEHFNGEGELMALVGGRVNVDHSWMDTLESEHVEGVLFSVFAILVFSWALFRSLSLGVMAVLPVVFSILMIYGTMGLFGIKLEPATSMFACISLGLGVDFGIHFVHRLVKVRKEFGHLEASAVAKEVSATARACYFNAAALAFGFSVMLFAQLPTLNRFGGLIAVAATASFFAALLILPALFQWLSQLRNQRFS